MSSVRAVSIRIGPSNCGRTWRQMDRPSSPGSIRSSTTRSGRSARIRAAASAPLASMSTFRPLPSRYSRVSSARRRSSSTIRMRRLLAPHSLLVSRSRSRRAAPQSGPHCSHGAARQHARNILQTLHIVGRVRAPKGWGVGLRRCFPRATNGILQRCRGLRTLPGTHAQKTHTLSTGFPRLSPCKHPISALSCIPIVATPISWVSSARTATTEPTAHGPL